MNIQFLDITTIKKDEVNMEYTSIDSNTSHCSDQSTFGRLSTRYDYVTKSITGDDDYPSDACQPWLHYNMRVGNIQVDQTVIAQQLVRAPIVEADLGKFSSVAAPFKLFDIPHPSKVGMRLRHACIEGPEVGVYHRGRLIGDTVINLPDYWDNLIDAETITVSFTPHTYYQELFVKSIEWGKRINVMNNTGGGIDCSYIIYAERKDVNKLEVEYREETNNAD